MMKIVFGGSGSGKSEFAEGLISHSDDCRSDDEHYDIRKLYIATMRVWDEEGRERVRKHRLQREGKGFETLEIPVNLGVLNTGLSKCYILLEDLSNLVMNEFYERIDLFESEFQDIFTDKFAEKFSNTEVLRDICTRIVDDIRKVSEQASDLVIVSNDIYSDGVTYSVEVEAYKALFAMVNRELFAIADEIYEVVVGIPIKIKG